MKIFRSFIFALLLVLPCAMLLAYFLYEPDIPVDKLKAKYTTPSSRFMDLEGMKVHYRIEGEGLPLVLVHGTGAMLQTWDSWTELLSPYYKIIRMDIPAFGLTGPRADNLYSDSMYVDFLEQFIQRLGVDSFYLAGNSLGGLIAWKYAAAHPDKVKKLILIDPAGFHELKGKGGSLIFNLARNFPELTDLISKIGTHYMIEHTLREVYSDDSKITPKEIKMYAELNRRTGNRHAFVERARAVRECSEDQLADIKCPVLVMWGKEDVLIDVGERKHFSRLSDVRFVLYDQVGHVPQEEIPDRSAADARQFLN